MAIIFTCKSKFSKLKLVPVPKHTGMVLIRSNGPSRKKTCLQRFANNKGTDQPAHTRRLISAFCYSLIGKYHF